MRTSFHSAFSTCLSTCTHAGLESEVLDCISVLSEAVGDHIDGDISTAEYLNQLMHSADIITRAMQHIVSGWVQDFSANFHSTHIVYTGNT